MNCKRYFPIRKYLGSRAYQKAAAVYKRANHATQTALIFRYLESNAVAGRTEPAGSRPEHRLARIAQSQLLAPCRGIRQEFDGVDFIGSRRAIPERGPAGRVGLR